MATKAEIKAQIQAALTLNAGVTDWAEMESYLIDENDSILENVYGNFFEDNSTDETHTTSNARFDYNLTFRQIGSQMIITGDFTVNNSASANVTLFEISNANLRCIAKNYNCETKPVIASLGESGGLRIINNFVFTTSSFIAGENHRFTLIYTLAQ